MAPDLNVHVLRIGGGMLAGIWPLSLPQSFPTLHVCPGVSYSTVVN